MMERGILTALVAVVVLAAVSALGVRLQRTFCEASAGLAPDRVVVCRTK